MSDVIKELFAVLGVKIDQESVKKADDALEGLTDLTKKLALGIAAAAGGIFAFTRQFSQAAAETGLWAERIGIGVDELTALDYAATKLVGDSQVLREALTDLGEKASDVFRNDPKGTSDAAESFKALGINIRDASGRLKGSRALFDEVADKLRRMEHRGDATGVAMRLFGDDVGRKIAPMMFAGADAIQALEAEAAQLGATLSSEDTKAAAGFAIAMGAAWKVLSGLATRVTAKIAPTMERLTESFMRWVGANREMLEMNLAGALDLLARILGGVAFAISRVIHHVTFFADKVGGLKNVLGALGVVVGLVLLKQLGAAALSVWKLVAGFGALTAAQIAAAIVPILVGAALVALGLIIEDLITYLQGGRSALGVFLDAIRDWEDYDPSKNPVLWLLQQIVKFLAYIERVGLDVLRNFIGGAFDAAKNLWSFDPNRMLEGAAAVMDPWDLMGAREAWRMEREFVGPREPGGGQGFLKHTRPGQYGSAPIYIQNQTVVANSPDELMSKMPASGGGYSAGDAVP